MQVSDTINIYDRAQVNKSNKNHYPIDDAEIVGDDTSESKLAHVVVTTAGSGLKSALQTNSRPTMHRQRAYMVNARQCSRAPTFHKFRTGLSLLYKLPKSFHSYF